MRILHTLLVSAAVCSLLSGLAVTPAAGGDARAHDGFFLRLATGFGGASAELSDPTGKVKLSGTGADVNIAVGGIVSPNLAIHGTLWGWALSDPDADITIVGVGSGSGTLNGELTMSAIGVGATYYFMPTNVYMTGSLGTGSLSGTKDMDGNSKAGFAVDLGLGKEWWVGESWGLGVAGGFNYFRAKDKDIIGVNEDWKGPGYSIRFSATFN